MIIFNEAKPKYEKLNELLLPIITDIQYTNQVTVVIDLKEVFRKFFRPDILKPSDSRKLAIEEISSDILNIVAHYRNYFFKNGKYSTFYFLFSKEKCNELMKLDGRYKFDYYDKYFSLSDQKSSILRSVQKVIEKVSEALPNVYFLDTSKYDEVAYGKFIKENTNKNQLLFFLTNDVTFYQLIDTNSFIITLKGIKSELITSQNVIEMLTGKTSETVNKDLIPLYISIIGNKKYSIEGILGIGAVKCLKMLEYLIENNLISNTSSVSMPIDFSKLSTEKNSIEKVLISNKDKVLCNFSITKIDSIYLKGLPLIQPDFVFKKTSSKASILLDINAKVFSLFPLNIDMICKGEKLDG